MKNKERAIYRVTHPAKNVLHDDAGEPTSYQLFHFVSHTPYV